jgi:peptidoglycan/LPS O-acetylase OafA/YrhL
MVFSPAEFWGRIAASLLFIAQSWNLSLAPPYNQPYWSLCYEVWYYVMYGAWLFAPRRWRWPALLLAALCAGPKILLLAPIWLTGVAVWHLRGRLPASMAVLFFYGFMLAGLLLFWFDVSVLLRNRLLVTWPGAVQQLNESALFIGDMLLGFAVAGNFLGAIALGERLRPLFCIERPVRFAASYSFSIYLYHMPLAVLLWNGLGLRSPMQMAADGTPASLVPAGRAARAGLTRARQTLCHPTTMNRASIFHFAGLLRRPGCIGFTYEWR